MSAPLPAMIIVALVLLMLFLSTAVVEAIVLNVLRWGPRDRCLRDAFVATAAGFMPGRFELLQLAFARPFAMPEIFAWTAVVAVTETGVYISLSRMGTGPDGQLAASEDTKLSIRTVLTALAANLASHMVLISFVVLVSRLVGR
ncbi:MAG: hypothetical protein Q8Q09_10025 [Deltaproteobacteria bacterium]|nr:hypothetical protein [Deltaproteobacteria bacterium]